MPGRCCSVPGVADVEQTAEEGQRWALWGMCWATPSLPLSSHAFPRHSRRCFGETRDLTSTNSILVPVKWEEDSFKWREDRNIAEE